MDNGILNIIEAMILPLNLLLVIIALEMAATNKAQKDLYFLFGYFAAALILDSAQFFYPKGENNLFIMHLAVPLEFFLFSMTLREWETKYKELYTISIVVVTVLLSLDSFVLTPWNDYPMTSMVAGSLSTLVFASRSIFVSDHNTKYMFLISFGILIYSSISAFVYPFFLTEILAVQVKIYVTEITYIFFIGGVFSVRNSYAG